MRLTELAYVWDILSQQEQMGCTIGLFLAVLTKNLMTMVTALLLCMAVWLHFEHSEPAVKSIFGCTNQKSYEFLIQPWMAISVHNSIKQCFTIPENKVRNQVITWFSHL